MQDILKFIRLLFDRIGYLFCNIGLHKYKSSGFIGMHPVKKCARCNAGYAEYWGGCRVGIRSPNNSDKNKL
jgi:hypothetical protein